MVRTGHNLKAWLNAKAREDRQRRERLEAEEQDRLLQQTARSVKRMNEEDKVSKRRAEEREADERGGQGEVADGWTASVRGKGMCVWRGGREINDRGQGFVQDEVRDLSHPTYCRPSTSYPSSLGQAAAGERGQAGQGGLRGYEEGHRQCVRLPVRAWVRGTNPGLLARLVSCISIPLSVNPVCLRWE